MRLHMLSTGSVFRPAAVAVLVLLAACSSMQRARVTPAPESMAATTAVAGDTPASTDESRPGIAQGAIARLLIRRATMQLEVENPEQVARRIAAVTASLGGFVEHSREASGSGVHLKVRVPAGALEDAMDSVATLGRVEKRQISADDVTEQVVDLDARVATRRAIRDRLRSLLDRAQSIQDVITVERELARVQGELDSLERRLEYLRGSASMADLSVNANTKRILGPLGLLAVGTARVLEKLFIWR